MLHTEETKSLALVTTCICYCILHFAWHMHVTKTHAGCTATAFMEPTRETAAQPGKNALKIPHFCTCAFTKSCRHKKYCKKEIKLPGVFWGFIKQPGASIALMKNLPFSVRTLPQKAGCEMFKFCAVRGEGAQPAHKLLLS